MSRTDHIPTKSKTVEKDRDFGPVRRKSDGGEPLRLETWDEVDQCYRAWLKPLRIAGNGDPVYSAVEVAELNIQYPDE